MENKTSFKTTRENHTVTYELNIVTTDYDKMVSEIENQLKMLKPNDTLNVPCLGINVKLNN